MPTYEYIAYSQNIRRDALLVDSCVLVAAFSQEDQSDRRDSANFVLMKTPNPIVLPSLVIGEAWGVIANRGPKVSARESAIRMLDWATAVTSNVHIVPCNHLWHELLVNTVRATGVDYVDALLMCLAKNFSEVWQISGGMKLVTYDGRDFNRTDRQQAYRYKFAHPQDFDITE